MNTHKRASDDIHAFITAAFKTGIEFIEIEARKILIEHPSLDEFVMAMGAATFTIKNDRRINSLWLDEREYFDELNQFINEFDQTLHFTGSPMRFTATGPVVKDW